MDDKMEKRSRLQTILGALRRMHQLWIKLLNFVGI